MCLKKIADENNSFFVTEEGGQVNDADLNGKFYCVTQINRREKHFIKHFIALFHKAFNILKKEKPDAIITTGALAAFPFCLIGKLMRKKVIYIETFARVNGKSLTGRLVYPFADIFLVQWKEMLKCYPKAIYVGGIF